jgi:hypothetical protein
MDIIRKQLHNSNLQVCLCSLIKLILLIQRTTTIYSNLELTECHVRSACFLFARLYCKTLKLKNCEMTHPLGLYMYVAFSNLDQVFPLQDQ